jgi:hypothetical protein
MVTAVNGGGAGGGGTVIVAIVGAAVAFLLLFLFGEGIYSGGESKKLDVDTDAPKVNLPDK